MLAVIKAQDVDDALAIANDTDYGLTDRISRQPCGGFKMSGVGSKAGASDYLPTTCCNS